MKENTWPEQRMCGHLHAFLLSRKGKIRSPSGQAIPGWSLAAVLCCTPMQTNTRSRGQKQANFMCGYSSISPIPPHVTEVCLCSSILTGSCPSFNFPICSEGSGLVGMQGLKPGTAEPCWDSQPELSPGCRAVSLSPYFLEGVALSPLVGRGLNNIVILHHHYLPVSDTNTDVFAFTVFHLCSFSLAGQLPSCYRAGIQRKAALQPSCGCPLPLPPHCWAAMQCGSRLFQIGNESIASLPGGRMGQT